MSEQALEGCRVLDLTDHKGALCGKILGDLGADVVKVEPPEGDASRRIGPFYHNINDAEFSLQWFSLNVNKRSITLNLEKEEGKELFSALVETANIVLAYFGANWPASRSKLATLSAESGHRLGANWPGW